MNKLINLKDEAATIALGAKIASLIKPGYLISLQGELGAGKSSLARSIIRYLMQDEYLEVPSPSFSLVQEYQRANNIIYHCDFYRLNDASEVLQLDLNILDENKDENIYLVEWPQKAGGLIRPAQIEILMQTIENQREAIICAQPEILDKL